MENSYPPFDVIFESLELNDEGVFWKRRPLSHFNCKRGCSVFNGRYAGTKAGTLLSPLNQYRIIWITYRGFKYQILEHIVVWLLHNGVYPKLNVDHLDGDGLNNKIENLVEKTVSENMHNKHMYSNNKSGYVGVIWYERYSKWRAYGTHAGVKKTIGYYEELEKAILARQNWEEGKNFTERHGRRL